LDALRVNVSGLGCHIESSEVQNTSARCVGFGRLDRDFVDLKVEF